MSLKKFAISTLSTFALGAVVLSSSPAAADDSPIYVVNLQKILNDSVIGKAARNNLEAEVKKREAQLEKMKAEVEALQQSLRKQSSVLSKEALKSKAQDLEKKQQQLVENFEEQS